MIKNFVTTFFILLSSVVFASEKMQLEALQDYSVNSQSETFSAQIYQDVFFDNIILKKGDKINCSLYKMSAPKRAKIDEKIYFNLLNYENEEGTHNFSQNYIGKYASNILKEKIKQTPPKKAVKSIAGTVGSQYIPGFSQALSLVDGIIENEENNRLKSGVKQVYKDSPLSLIEKGEEIEIKKGDIFYLIIKQGKEDGKN